MVLRLTLPRWPPLAPEFVVARGEVARALARLLLADPARLAGLRGVVSFGELLPSLSRARDATDDALGRGRALDPAAPGEGELGRDLARGGEARPRDALLAPGEGELARDLARSGRASPRDALLAPGEGELARDLARSGRASTHDALLAPGEGELARDLARSGRASPRDASLAPGELAGDLARGGGASPRERDTNRAPAREAGPTRADESRAAATERTPEPPHILAVTGDDLPWLDGVEYFGRDGAASWLLVPTTRTGPLPTSWLERRYRAGRPSLDWPCLLLDDVLLPVGRAAAFDRDRLSRWCSDG